MMFLPLENKTFYIRHLLDSDSDVVDIQSFSINQPSAKGLEIYLKNEASKDEVMSLARTYLIKSKQTDEIAAYFTLRNGLFTLEIPESSFVTIPAIELSNFAVNSSFRSSHPEIEEIGSTVLADFVLPIADFLRHFSGAKALYIYSLPQEKLIKHYEKLGFMRLEKDEEKFVHQHVKPEYDTGCIFMYQILA